jgi:hypothetical protein
MPPLLEEGKFPNRRSVRRLKDHQANLLSRYGREGAGPRLPDSRASEKRPPVGALDATPLNATGPFPLSHADPSLTHCRTDSVTFCTARKYCTFLQHFTGTEKPLEIRPQIPRKATFILKSTFERTFDCELCLRSGVCGPPFLPTQKGTLFSPRFRPRTEPSWRR